MSLRAADAEVSAEANPLVAVVAGSVSSAGSMLVLLEWFCSRASREGITSDIL